MKESRLGITLLGFQDVDGLRTSEYLNEIAVKHIEGNITNDKVCEEVHDKILDIVIAVMNEKSGGSTKYINRREQNYVTSALSDENYHRN